MRTSSHPSRAANYALVQPSIQADAPKIAKSIVDVLGGGKVPTLAELGARGYSDPKLDRLLRRMIQKEATAEQVKQIAAEVETDVAFRVLGAGLFPEFRRARLRISAAWQIACGGHSDACEKPQCVQRHLLRLPLRTPGAAPVGRAAALDSPLTLLLNRDARRASRERHC